MTQILCPGFQFMHRLRVLIRRKWRAFFVVKIQPRRLSKDLRQYREELVQADRDASKNFDRLLLTLSSGGLAVSVSFIRQVVPHPSKITVIWLEWGWFSLVVTLIAALLSAITSQLALRRAMKQTDAGVIRKELPGAEWTMLTKILSYLGALACVVGVSCIVRFAILNL